VRSLHFLASHSVHVIIAVFFAELLQKWIIVTLLSYSKMSSVLYIQLIQIIELKTGIENDGLHVGVMFMSSVQL